MSRFAEVMCCDRPSRSMDKELFAKRRVLSPGSETLASHSGLPPKCCPSGPLPTALKFRNHSKITSLQSRLILIHACSPTSPTDILDATLLSASSHLIHMTFKVGCADNSCEPWRLALLYLRDITMNDCNAVSSYLMNGHAMPLSKAKVSSSMNPIVSPRAEIIFKRTQPRRTFSSALVKSSAWLVQKRSRPESLKGASLGKSLIVIFVSPLQFPEASLCRSMERSNS